MAEAPDWDPRPECGNGLYGFLRGEGDGALANKGPDGKWLVLRVRESDIVVIGADKAKFPRGEVIYCGDMQGASALVKSAYPERAVIGAIATAGDYGTATAGFMGEIRLRYFDGKRHRTAIGYIGEAGLLPNVPYVLDSEHQFKKKA